MRQFIYITWLNNLGGFEYWLFVGHKDHILEVQQTAETKKNIFPQWPKSYGAFSDTITKQTFRRTKKQKLVRSQNLTATQAEQMGEEIKSSPVVQIVTGTGKRDRRTVVVDNGSITVRKEIDKIHSLSFTISYTDEYPTQHT